MTAGKISPHHEGMRGTGLRGWSGRLAWVMASAAVALAFAAVIGAGLAGMTLTAAVDTFVVTNTVMALAFPSCGLILAARRPANPTGWLFLGAGLGHAVTAAVVPPVVTGMGADWPDWLLKLLATVGAAAWPWSIAVFLPVALLLFPDGLPPSPRWRWLIYAEVVTGSLFVVECGADKEALGAGTPAGYLSFGDSYGTFQPLWAVAELRTVACFLVGIGALVVRYRRGGERERRQLLWLILAALVTIGVLIPWGIFLAGPILMLLAIPLIGVAVTIAILRYQLLDIRLVVSRALVYLTLTAAVVAAYAALVALFDLSLRRWLGLGTSALATLLVAIGFNPVRVWMQRQVDRAVYGDRSDPVRAVSSVSARLADADAGLTGTVEALCSALRLPFAALRSTDAEISSSGVMPATLRAIPLTYGSERVGELVIGLRAGEKDLSPADRALLDLLAAPLSVAVRALALSAELQRSRERIVGAREEERRRIRRDLHDGLGPVLTGVTLQADLVRHLVLADPVKALDTLADLRRQTVGAIKDVRRVAYGLRPPSLDELGLLAALRQQIEQLSQQADGGAIVVDFDLPATVPTLPAAVESAAYRIIVEAFTNAVRHARPRQVWVHLRIGRELHIELRDDGGDRPDAAARTVETADVERTVSRAAMTWRTGVGLRSMFERAAELGGSCVAGPSAAGGVVTARLPLWGDWPDGDVDNHES